MAEAHRDLKNICTFPSKLGISELDPVGRCRHVFANKQTQCRASTELTQNYLAWTLWR